ncbi:MAG: DUF4231 domain-containing protein [Methylocystis sp.]
MSKSEWTPETFISQRVKQYQGWYDAKAVAAKKKYLSMRGFSVVAGILVPILINFPHDPVVFDVHIIKAIATLISLLMTAFISLEGVLRYREQWKNYRSTEQKLGHETIYFKGGIGVYRNLALDDAFRLFVERVEDAIRAENAATLNVMTTAGEPSGTKEVGETMQNS